MLLGDSVRIRFRQKRITSGSGYYRAEPRTPQQHSDPGRVDEKLQQDSQPRQHPLGCISFIRFADR
mgnify:CR=1 FL=1